MKTIVKYIRLYFTFVGFSLNRELQYRVNFFVIIIGYLFYLGANLALFGVIYNWINNLGDWSFNQALIFLGSYHLIHGLWDFSAALNLDMISHDVGEGNLDLILVKPINSLFFVLFRRANFAPLINVILGTVLVIIGVNTGDVQFSFLTVLAYIPLLFNGVIIFTMIQLLVQLISFWVIRTNVINKLFYNFIKFAEKPDVIFTGIMRFVFMFVFPLLIIVNVPSRILMGKITIELILYNYLITIVLVTMGICGWNFAVRAYSSASS